ncbi:putative ATP-dependent DNA helicase [Trypanosoma grayi]|uniref:putative ATP-dependent DNA helicase n=1 Tax=Trypanosoma grayi TaxID=71804 RepID=UPI0004F3FB3D|nr:putative ATP-dependent DNA helicase [Trypanosoma grayi]KEG06065.1 putative ATP-dependent DNA helicase [Trypanosoma grayi]
MRAGAELDPSRQAAYLFRFYQTMLHEQRNAVDFGDLEQMFLDALRPVKQQQQQQEEKKAVTPTAGIHNDSDGKKNASNGSSAGGMSSAPLPFLPSPVAMQLRAQYTHIVVDEFQDLNEVQLECLALLAGDSCRVTCVGDPNQCIYTWRGATTNSFERWRSRFPQTKLVQLETNYRSSAEIVGAVNEVTRLSQKSFKGHCGRRITLVQCQHASEQLQLLPRVVEDLLRSRDSTLRYGDIAILCRTRRTVRDVVAALDRDQLPVCELRRSTPNSTASVRAMLSYLRLCVHPHSNLDVECVIRDAPNHFTAAAATKFVFALQAECLQRRRQLGTAELQREDSHAAYSYYTILRELVHNGFAHVHERLRTTKQQQKFLRVLIEVTTAAHDALGRVYCDVEDVVRGVAERAGFDEGGARGVRISRHASGGTKRPRSSGSCGFSAGPTLRRHSAATWDEMGGGDDDDDSTSEAADGMSIPQLLVEACGAVQKQVLAEKCAAAGEDSGSEKNDGDDNNLSISSTSNGIGVRDAAEIGVAVTDVKDDAYTIVQRVIDEFLALLPTDDFGPLQGSVKAERRPASITVTTVHQAKGKEWPAVIVPCCYEGEFPIDARSAEEKRVFYVAMSRAMRDLVFMTAERGPSATRSYECSGGGEEQPLHMTPYLRPILPLMETVNMSCHEQQQ